MVAVGMKMQFALFQPTRLSIGELRDSSARSVDVVM